jgi:hypothetical protein
MHVLRRWLSRQPRAVAPVLVGLFLGAATLPAQGALPSAGTATAFRTSPAPESDPPSRPWKELEDVEYATLEWVA